MKRCSRCELTLPSDKFHKSSRSKDGLNAWCKPCRRAYLAENAEHVRERHHDYLVRTGRIGEGARKRKRYASGDPTPPRLRRYGLSVDDFDALQARAQGACEICGTLVELVIDHCHETGLVRGLLCSPCNAGLGMFHDSDAKLLAAIDYLRRTRVSR